MPTRTLSTKLLILLAALFFMACDRDAPHESATGEAAVRDLTEIRELPVGLKVTHSPNPAPAMEGGRSGFPYTWLYETKVESIDQDLTLEEFGAFVEHEDGWHFSTYTAKPFTPEDFAEWYGCPDAKLVPGKVFVDRLNWSGARQLKTLRTIWYFVAVDPDGKRYRGEALIEQLAEIGESRVSQPSP
ncbi:MAG: hypothetical protein AAF333_12710 [Planctomycetota bacterium]